VNRSPAEPTGEWLDRFNAPGVNDQERYSLLVERFASVGEHALIRPPFFCDYAQHLAGGRGLPQLQMHHPGR
jgi:maltose O-acetyltransferase